MRGTVHKRAGDEQGFALVSAIMIMVLVLLVTAVGALAVVRSFDETRRDRSSTTALSAADSAIDILAWRMNKQLTASEIENLDGLTSARLGQLGCVDVDAEGLVQLSLSASSCTLEMPAVGDGAAATCESTLAVTLTTGGLVDLTALDGLLARDVVCSSTVNGATRRIFARLSLDVTVAGTLASPTSLWQRTSWKECPSDPDAACPPA
jgi:Tfp pilus assembly protein PilX